MAFKTQGVIMSLMAGGLDDLTKSLARMPDLLRQADYIVPRDHKLEMMAEMARTMKSAPQVQAENVQNAIRTHIEELQAKLGPEQELVIYHGTGLEFIRVLQIAMPNHHVVILLGHDEKGNIASVVSNVGSLHLTCKVVKVEAPQKPQRIGFIIPEQAHR